MNAEVRVLVVDDSAFFRRRVTELLNQTSGIQVVGDAADGQAAIHEAKRLKPDVITMDVEMPVMDGISAVKRIMSEAPTRILMFSVLTRDGASATLDALEAGAVDFLPKEAQVWARNSDGTSILGQRVMALAKQARRKALPAELQEQKPRLMPGVKKEVPSLAGRCKLVAIGASTGGPIALQKVLTSLPADFPLPLLLVVHMPGDFTTAFAQRLDSLCRIGVREAVDGDVLRPGLALLAPGGKQMELKRRGSDMAVRISDPQPGQTYRPSVDVTFNSSAMAFPGGVLAVVLTGMGADGYEGARLLKAGGSTVWSQDEASCVVFGMPRAIEKAGLSDQVLSLDQIGPLLAKVV